MAHHLVLNCNDDCGLLFHRRHPWLAPYSPGRGQYVGVAASNEPQAAMLAVVMYSEYTPPRKVDGKIWGGTCQVGVASWNPCWATPGMITHLLSIPFSQYNCRKLVTVVPSINERSRRLSKGLGFKPEGTLRHHFADGVHAEVSGMLRREFEAKWLNRRGPQTSVRPSHGPLRHIRQHAEPAYAS